MNNSKLVIISLLIASFTGNCAAASDALSKAKSDALSSTDWALLNAASESLKSVSNQAGDNNTKTLKRVEFATATEISGEDGGQASFTGSVNFNAELIGDANLLVELEDWVQQGVNPANGESFLATLNGSGDYQTSISESVVFLEIFNKKIYLPTEFGASVVGDWEITLDGDTHTVVTDYATEASVTLALPEISATVSFKGTAIIDGRRLVFDEEKSYSQTLSQ